MSTLAELLCLNCVGTCSCLGHLSDRNDGCGDGTRMVALELEAAEAERAAKEKAVFEHYLSFEVRAATEGKGPIAPTATACYVPIFGCYNSAAMHSGVDPRAAHPPATHRD